MRIGLVVERFDPAAGGLERWAHGFARFLAQHGDEPVVLTFGAANADPTLPVRTLRPARGVLARARAVENALATLGADAVLDTGVGWSADVLMPCTGSRRLSQRRLVASHPWPLRLRAALSPRSRWLDRSLALLERRQVRNARRIVAVSARVSTLLVDRLGADPARIVTVPNGVDTASLAPERLAPLRDAARAALGWPDRVLFLASAHNPWLKGVDTALRALARLPDAAALVVAGAHEDARWTTLLAPVRARARFLGPVPDMRPLFAASDALVHPTRWDAASLSTLEAGAAGLPVITTVADGSAALIEDGVTGAVLPNPEDVDALAAHMRRLLDPALRHRMGDAARRAAPAHDVAANYAAVRAVLEDTAQAKLV